MSRGEKQGWDFVNLFHSFFVRSFFLSSNSQVGLMLGRGKGTAGGGGDGAILLFFACAAPGLARSIRAVGLYQLPEVEQRERSQNTIF